MPESVSIAPYFSRHPLFPREIEDDWGLFKETHATSDLPPRVLPQLVSAFPPLEREGFSQEAARGLLSELERGRVPSDHLAGTSQLLHWLAYFSSEDRAREIPPEEVALGRRLARHLGESLSRSSGLRVGGPAYAALLGEIGDSSLRTMTNGGEGTAVVDALLHLPEAHPLKACGSTLIGELSTLQKILMAHRSGVPRVLSPLYNALLLHAASVRAERLADGSAVLWSLQMAWRGTPPTAQPVFQDVLDVLKGGNFPEVNRDLVRALETYDPPPCTRIEALSQGMTQTMWALRRRGAGMGIPDKSPPPAHSPSGSYSSVRQFVRTLLLRVGEKTHDGVEGLVHRHFSPQATGAVALETQPSWHELGSGIASDVGRVVRAFDMSAIDRRALFLKRSGFALDLGGSAFGALVGYGVGQWKRAQTAEQLAAYTRQGAFAGGMLSLGLAITPMLASGTLAQGVGLLLPNAARMMLLMGPMAGLIDSALVHAGVENQSVRIIGTEVASVALSLGLTRFLATMPMSLPATLALSGALMGLHFALSSEKN